MSAGTPGATMEWEGIHFMSDERQTKLVLTQDTPQNPEIWLFDFDLGRGFEPCAYGE